MSLTPRGMSIQEAYRLYSEDKLKVNRRYQRKLVWSEAEKQKLIDSIQKELPIPLFMLAREKGAEYYEIIDGMQRLNAIFSFIEHGFVTFEGLCFDIAENTRAKDAVEAGKFVEFDASVTRLSSKDCANLQEYQLAVTIDDQGDQGRVNEIFGRINSGGRRLSPQEQRQAGLVSPFSEYVRKVAIELRGDASPDILSLNQMPEVSFNTPKEKQRYGINASDIFWCKHGIVSPKELSQSEDEQILVDVSISIINGEPLNASREVFDDYFDPESDRFKKLNESLLSYGEEKLRAEVLAVIGSIRSVFEADPFLSFRDCVRIQNRNTAKTAFFATFMAFHKLLFTNSSIPENFDEIRKSLDGVQRIMTRTAHHATTEDRVKNISQVRGLVQDYFVKQDVAVLGVAQGLVIDLENSLRRAKYEANRYEFKIGICKLSNKPGFDENIVPKIVKTATAISNLGPESDGYIYLGVADNKDSAERIKALHEIEPIQIGDCYFTGLESDLRILNIDLEQYIRKLIAIIRDQPVSDNIKTSLVSSLDHATYKGRPFVRMRIPKQTELSEFSGRYYIRRNSETEELSSPEAVAQARRF